MKRTGCAILTVLIILTALQPLIYARAGTQGNNGEDFEAYSARYIVKYASDSRRDEEALLKGAKPALKKAKEQKNAAVAAVLAVEDEQVKNERLERKLRIRLEGMDSSVETSALDISTESQYEVIQLEEAVPPSVFMEALQQQSGEIIEYIQPDYVMSLATNKNAASDEVEPVELHPLSEALTNVPDNTSPGMGQQTIALLDTGVDIDHPDLAGHLAAGYDFFNQSDVVDAQDRSLADVHGTHLAGIIAETAPEAKIMPLKVFQDGVAYTSDIIEAIHYAEENGASIVNCSWGSSDNNMALQDTIAGSSMLFVCAAGNNGNNVDEKPVYPGAFGLDNIVNVTSVNDTMALSYFSNYGTDGVDIAYRGRDIESTYPGGTRNKLNGTSVSAAFVSAAASLSSGTTPTEKKQQLLETADNLSYLEDKVLSGNYLNLENLVSGIGGSRIEISPEADPNADHSTVDVNDSWQLFANSNCKKIAVGYNYSLFLMSGGEVYVAGGNKRGFRKLCIGMKDVVHMYENNFLLLTTNGNVTSVYGDSFGDGNTMTYTISSGDIVEIAASESGQKLALTSGGTVWGWGENSNGEAGEGEPIIEDGRLIMFDSIRSPKLIETTADEILSNITKIRAASGSSYALDNEDNLYNWGWRYRGYTDYEDCYAKQISGNVQDIQISGSSYLVRDGNNEYNVCHEQKAVGNWYYGAIQKMSGNFVIKDDGSLWMWNVSTEFSEPEIECGPFKDLTGVLDVFGKEDGGFAIKEDGSVWCWGDNSSGRLGVEGDTILTPVEVGIVTEVNKEVISSEEYAVEGNPAYQAGSEQLEQLGWKADNALNGNFTAESGKLVIQKNSPVESGSNDIVYSVSKQFTQRTDEWNGDPRVSVWTNHFKGDYGIEIQGSFHQNSSWMYYDILGATNTGTPANVARYKIGPTSKGAFSVYNNQLNGADTRDYTLWENPTANNSILTKLMSSQAVFQTYLNGDITPVKTTVAGASPDDMFNMTDWNEREPAEYITGLKFSVQGKELAGSTVASLDHVKLIEYAASYDAVDYAIDSLSIGELTQTPEAVTENLNPLAHTIGDAVLSWTSSRPDIIRDDGTLVGFTNRDTDVIMTAKITNPTDNYTKYKEFRLTVPGRDGFLETYPDPITGTPSSAGKEGTKTFEQLPMWNFSYPGISNGTNGEIHTGQVLVKDGYLTFKKGSDRQTDNYNECVVGTRSLSNKILNPALQSVNISFKAKAEGTGTMRFAPLNIDGKAVCTIILDASVKAVDITYGDLEGGNFTQVKQHLTDINPRFEHQYDLQMNRDGTFIFRIDGNVILTDSGSEKREYTPWAGDNRLLSQMKVWITNITRQNTEIGKLKFLDVQNALELEEQATVLNVCTSANDLQTISISGPNEAAVFEVLFDPLFLVYDSAVPIDGVMIEDVSDGKIKFTFTEKPAEAFDGILCRLQFKSVQAGNTAVTLYRSKEAE